MNKETRQKRTKSAVSFLLICAILIGGAFAFLTAQDSKTNVFTVGKVNVELWEKFDTNTNGTIDDGETYDATTKTPPTVENIVPGQTVLKEPYVVNKGTTPCTLYMSVSVPTITSDEAFVDNDSSLTIDGSKKIEVKAFAFQEGYNGASDVFVIWNSFYEKNSSIFGEECNENRVEVFDINGLNTDSWEGVWYVTSKNENNEYFNTYVWVYTGTFIEEMGRPNYLLEPNATTSSLFASVSINGRIGEKITNTNSLTGTTTTFVNTQITDESIYSYPDDPMTAYAAYNSYWLTGGVSWNDTESSNYWNVIEIGRHLNTLGANIDFSFNSVDVMDYGNYEAYAAAEKTAAQTILEYTDIYGIKNSNDGYGTGAKISAFLENNGGANEILYNVIIYGDLNGDGKITADDATLLQQAIDGTITLTTAQKIAADISRDEGVGLSNKDYVPELTQDDYDALQTVIKGEKTPDNKKIAVINQTTGRVEYVVISEPVPI